MSFKKIHNRSSIIGVVLVALLLMPGVASAALELEYFTYGGFSEVVSAFTKLALIQSSAGIKTLVAALWVGLFAWGLISINYNKLTQVGAEEGETVIARGSVPSVIIGMIFGAMFYIGFVIPTGTLHIYDKTENQYQAVGGIPLIVVAGAGAINMIEKAVIDLSETAGDPQSFSKQGGAKGIMVMNALMMRSGGAPSSDALLGQTLTNYVGSCVSFELSRPGTTLTHQELIDGTDSLKDSYAKAVNPNVYTTVFEGTPSGVGMSCTDAWANILPRINNADFDSSEKNACKDAGYQVFQSDAAKATLAFNACKSNTDALMATINPSWNLKKLATEGSLAYPLLILASEYAPHLIADRNKSVYGASLLQELMPSLASKRGQLVAVATAALPFVLLLMATRMWFPAIKIALGFYLLPAIWGILMAIVSDFYISSAVSAWSELLAPGKLGLSTYSIFSSSLMKEMNWWGIYLAGTFALALSISAKLGGLASMAGAGAKSAASATEGDIPLGRQGAGARERAAVLTSEGAMASHVQSIDAKEFANTSNRGATYAQYKGNTGAGIAQGQQQVNATLGAAGAGGAGSVTMPAMQNGAGHNAMQATGGLANAIAAESFAKSADIAKKGMQAEGFNGDFFELAKQGVANDLAIHKTFGNDENYQRFLESQHGKSAGDMAGAMQAYSQVKEQIRTSKGDKAADNYTWQGHNAAMSEVKAGKDFAATEAFRGFAAANNMNPLQMSRVGANFNEYREGNKVLTASGGTTLSPEKGQALHKTIGEKVTMATQAKAEQAVQGLQQNLASGNVAAIQQDKAQMAAMAGALNMTPEQLAKATPQEMKQNMEQAKQALQTGTQTPEQKQAALNRAGQGAYAALDQQEKQQVAQVAKEFGVKPEALQGQVDNLKNTPDGPDKEKTFVGAVSRENGGLKLVPEAIAAAGAVVGRAVGGHEGTAVAARVEATNAAGGNAAVRTAVEQSTSRDLAKGAQETTANKAQFEAAHPEIGKENREFYKADGTLTPLAQYQTNLSREGKNAGEFSTQDGVRSVNLDGNGKLVNSTEKGTIAAGDKDAIKGMQEKLQQSGFVNAAGAIGRLGDKATDFRATYDKNGKISTFEMGSGGSGKYTDRFDKDTGTTDRHTQNKVEDYTKKYDSGDRRNTTNEDLSGNVKRDTQENTKIVKSGEIHDTVDANGTHTTGVGVTNPRTGQFTLTDGTVSQITQHKAVETVRDAEGNAVTQAAVTRTGDKYGTVATSADASTSFNGAKTSVTGESITSVQTVSAVASDGSLTGGTVAQGIAIGERSVSVAAAKVSEVANIVSGGLKVGRSATAQTDSFREGYKGAVGTNRVKTPPPAISSPPRPPNYTPPTSTPSAARYPVPPAP